MTIEPVGLEGEKAWFACASSQSLWPCVTEFKSVFRLLGNASVCRHHTPTLHPVAGAEMQLLDYLWSFRNQAFLMDELLGEGGNLPDSCLASPEFSGACLCPNSTLYPFTSLF